MSVITPATGQKITDFSAGNVDANSVFIQANNGNTTKVTATQIGEYSNLNLLFNGAGGLDTTAKTIVGAINEVDGKDAGDIPFDNTASGMTATDVQSAIDEVVDNGSYHVGDTIDISALVLSCYSTSTRLDIYVPLKKTIPSGATLTIAGNWRIILTNSNTLASSVVLNNAALSSIGTVSTVILEGGLSIRVALNSGVVPNWSLGNVFAMGSNSIAIS